MAASKDLMTLTGEWMMECYHPDEEYFWIRWQTAPATDGGGVDGGSRVILLNRRSLYLRERSIWQERHGLWQRAGKGKNDLCGGTCGCNGVKRSWLELSGRGGVERSGLELSGGSREHLTCCLRIYFGRGQGAVQLFLEQTRVYPSGGMDRNSVVEVVSGWYLCELGAGMLASAGGREMGWQGTFELWGKIFCWHGGKDRCHVRSSSKRVSLYDWDRNFVGDSAEVNLEVKSSVTIVSLAGKPSTEVELGDELLFEGSCISW